MSSEQENAPQKTENAPQKTDSAPQKVDTTLQKTDSPPQKTSQKIVSFMSENPKITRHELSLFLTISEDAVKQHIVKLVEKKSFAATVQTKAAIGKFWKRNRNSLRHVIPLAKKTFALKDCH